MRYKTIMVFKYITFLLITPLIIGCSLHNRSSHHHSNIMTYLYPDKQVQQKPEIPFLTLPLKVGIAFVPESNSAEALTEKTKIDLLNKVASNFKQYSFIDEIQIIPSVYLRQRGSFSNLDQIQSMYGIDVIALVSYDQQQFSNDGILSFAYWTIIGAYVIPASKNDTHTMVDTVVFDIKSRKMLFRAPGISHIKGNSTPINLSEQLRADSTRGFELASENLIKNLDNELQNFRDKVKEQPEQYQIIQSPGYKGGGSVDIWLIVTLLILSVSGFWLQRQQKV